MITGRYFVVLALTLRDAEQWAARNGLPKRQGWKAEGGRWMYASSAEKLAGLRDCEFIVLNGFWRRSNAPQIMESAVAISTCYGCEIRISEQEAACHPAVMMSLVGCGAASQQQSLVSTIEIERVDKSAKI